MGVTSWEWATPHTVDANANTPNKTRLFLSAMMGTPYRDIIGRDRRDGKAGEVTGQECIEISTTDLEISMHFWTESSGRWWVNML
jgi:hypothetical protein